MQTHHTPAERMRIRALLRAIGRNGQLCPDKAEARRIMAFAAECFEQGVPLRDAFGLSRMETALEAACLAATEIGLRGSMLRAMLIYEAAKTPEAKVRAAELFGTPTEQALACLERLESLTERTEALRTENFRNFFVAQSGDMRAVLLLIAKCVVLMRSVKETEAVAERRKLALEAAHLFAPLAHKLGLYRLKSELEDLSLKYLEHDAYYLIKERLSATKRSRDAYIARFIEPIARLLDAEGLKYHIKGRTKSIHSIWQKMKKQNCGFEGVYDLFAIRIILESPQKKEIDQCWKVFSLITAHYESNLKRLRDWLTVPKSNGYESLHITVKGPEEKWVEVQIRSERMDEVAERGLAAHWRYKGVKSGEGDVEAWLSDIRSALESGDESSLKKSLSSNKNAEHADVYVFTPKGDLFKLPHGSTVLDFAYQIHTGVGNHCTGARIDGRNVPIRHKLESGATVEILTSSAQSPKADWLNIVVSGHAKAKIRSAVRDLQARSSALARELLERKLKNKKLDWDESIINQLVKRAGFKESLAFYRAIAEEQLDIARLIDLYVEISRYESGQGPRAAARSAEEFDTTSIIETGSQDGQDVMVIDRGLKGIDFQMARCCNPVYGDEVFGFVTSGGGIKIHRCNCPNAEALRNRFGYRIVRARWAGKGGGQYPITLHVVGHDDLGIVNNITSIISKEEHIQLRSINIDSNDGLFSGILTVMVDEVERLSSLIKKIRGVRGVKAVSRS